MVAHKAAFNAGEVECLVILVVVILGAEVFIPVVGHILLEESYKVFEKFKAMLSQFIAELATGDDDAPVGVVAHALAVYLITICFKNRHLVPGIPERQEETRKICPLNIW